MPAARVARRWRSALVVGVAAACLVALVGVVRAEDGGCAVSYDDEKQTCGDAEGEKPADAGTSRSVAGDASCVTEPGVDYPGKFQSLPWSPGLVRAHDACAPWACCSVVSGCGPLCRR